MRHVQFKRQVNVILFCGGWSKMQYPTLDHVNNFDAYLNFWYLDPSLQLHHCDSTPSRQSV